MTYELFSLAEMLSLHGEEVTGEILASFTCSKDPDRESYLHDKAIMMEKKAMSRTYVAVTKDVRIVGYFSVGMKCMGVPEGVSISNSLKKKLNVNNETGIAQMYLIGQLARSDVLCLEPVRNCSTMRSTRFTRRSPRWAVVRSGLIVATTWSCITPGTGSRSSTVRTV